MQIIEFFRIGHDEVSGPEQACFSFGEWNGDGSEWTEFILETAKPFYDLRRGNWYGHDRRLLQPTWRRMWKTKLSRKDKMPRLKDPRRQVFCPFPPCSSLPVCNGVGRL